MREKLWKSNSLSIKWKHSSSAQHVEEGEETWAAKANSIGTEFVMQIWENEAALTDLHSLPPLRFSSLRHKHRHKQTDMPTHMHNAHMAWSGYADLQTFDSQCTD